MPGRPVRIHLPASQARRFREAARRAFPKECYGILLGTQTEGKFRVECIYIPKDQDDHTTPSSVVPIDDWYDEAEDEAGVHGWSMIGDIHSHCYSDAKEEGYDAAPSEIDADRAGCLRRLFGPYVYGICLVQKKKGVLRSRIRFWEGHLPPKVVLK